MTLFIGDVHGKFDRYKTILKQHPKDTIQVGDMGVGFRRYPHGEYSSNPPYDRMVEGNHRFIRGNHDNPNVCRNHTQWIPDGTVEGDTMFIGGAVSIDQAYRIRDYSWWEDEELSYDELDKLVQLYTEVKPRRMVTHECPERVAYAINHRTYKFDWPSTSRQAFDNMLAIHQPEVWIFGHWHKSFDDTIYGTRFVCLNELETKEIE